MAMKVPAEESALLRLISSSTVANSFDWLVDGATMFERVLQRHGGGVARGMARS
jgi:hypothetical protein